MGLLDLFGHKYPDTNFHELNLDWCITAILDMQAAWAGFSAGNKLIFSDPLQHDLTKTYAKNTIVVDPVSGSAYLSLDAVPKGVQLDNADYWLPVFDFAGYSLMAVGTSYILGVKIPDNFDKWNDFFKVFNEAIKNIKFTFFPSNNTFPSFIKTTSPFSFNV